MPDHRDPDPQSLPPEAPDPDAGGGSPGSEPGEPKNGARLQDRFEPTGASWPSPLGDSWAACDHDRKRDVLLTLLPRSLTESEWVLRQVAAEVDILSHLKEESIVRVLDLVTEDEGAAYRVEEFVGGENLTTLL